MAIPKDQVAFFVRRAIKAADDRADVFEHEAMARRGVPIADRSAEHARGEVQRQEAAALRAALECVERHYR